MKKLLDHLTEVLLGTVFANFDFGSSRNPAGQNASTAVLQLFVCFECTSIATPAWPSAPTDPAK